MNALPDTRTSARIAELRLARGLNQRQLATQHVRYEYIARLEAGTRRPTWSALIRLAEKLDTTALYLGTGRTHDCPVCKH